MSCFPQKNITKEGGIGFFVEDPTELCELFRMEMKVRWLLEIFNVLVSCPYIVYKNNTVLGNVFTLEHLKNHFILLKMAISVDLLLSYLLST